MTAEYPQVTENTRSKIMEVLHSLFMEQRYLREKIERMEKIMEQLIIQEKIERLEKEKASLSAEMESLRGKGEERANKLENEVNGLRKEVQALKELLKESRRKKAILQ